MIWKVLPPTSLLWTFRSIHILRGANSMKRAEGKADRIILSNWSVKSKERRHGSTWGPQRSSPFGTQISVEFMVGTWMLKTQAFRGHNIKYKYIYYYLPKFLISINCCGAAQSTSGINSRGRQAHNTWLKSGCLQAIKRDMLTAYAVSSELQSQWSIFFGKVVKRLLRSGFSLRSSFLNRRNWLVNDSIRLKLEHLHLGVRLGTTC